MEEAAAPAVPTTEVTGVVTNTTTSTTRKWCVEGDHPRRVAVPQVEDGLDPVFRLNMAVTFQNEFKKDVRKKVRPTPVIHVPEELWKLKAMRDAGTQTGTETVGAAGRTVGTQVALAAGLNPAWAAVRAKMAGLPPEDQRTHIQWVYGESLHGRRVSGHPRQVLGEIGFRGAESMQRNELVGECVPQDQEWEQWSKVEHEEIEEMQRSLADLQGEVTKESSFSGAGSEDSPAAPSVWTREHQDTSDHLPSFQDSFLL